MRTEQLIYLLASDETSPRPIVPRLMRIAGVGLLLAAFVALLALGVRDDLMKAMSAPVTAMKWLLPLGVAIPALLAAISFISPVTQRTPILRIALASAVVAGLWLLFSMITTPNTEVWPGIRGSSAFICLISVTTISVPPLVAALWVLRDGASTAPALNGGCIGLAVGGFATAIYAIHCNEDAPLFFLVWYSLAILIVAAAGAIAGKRLLKW